MKKLFWANLVRFIIGAIALGIGIWYVSSSLDNASITYISMDSFLNSIGITDGNIASANGCFLCGYVNDLFTVLGNAAEKFWSVILDNLWILMVFGFGIFLIIHTIQHVYKAMTETGKFDTKEKKLEFGSWFDTVWRQGARVMIVGALIGAFGMGGISSIKTLSNVTIAPVMYIGTELSMAATNVSSSTECIPTRFDINNPMAPIANSFMCIVGNINTVILAGAAGGFAMMNYAWMGLGGGVFTWVAGLLVVIMFVVMGFNLFFQMLSIIFKLVFLVIFLPLIVAASAFEKTWKMASSALKNSITMLVNAAIKVIGISLKVIIVFAMLAFAGNEMFPGAGLFPPLLGVSESADAQTLSVKNTFALCEAQSVDANGKIDKDVFKNCFTAQQTIVEARYPDAFDFMRDGFGFILLMAALIFIYFYVLSPRIDKLIADVPSFEPFGKSDDKGGIDDFGGDLKKLAKMTWKKPQELADKLIKE